MENRVIYKKRFPKEEWDPTEEEKEWWRSYNKKLKVIPNRVAQGKKIIKATIAYSESEKVDADIIFSGGLIVTNLYFKISFLNRSGMDGLFKIAELYDNVRFHSYNIGPYEVAIELCFRTHKK